MDSPPSTQIVVKRPGALHSGGHSACLVQIYPTGEGIGGRHTLGVDPLLLGRDAKCQIQVKDDSASRFHATLSLQNGLYQIADQRSTNGTYVNDEKIVMHVLRDGDYIRVGRHIFRFLTGGNVEALYHEEIARLVITDALTGLPNRRALIDFLGRELARASRHGSPMSLVMFDIDHFKAINDRLGHLAGDCILRDLAARLRGAIRAEDVLARYGGEEFALALPDCGSDEAARIAERLRVLVSGEPFAYGDQRVRVTISLGVATAAHGELPPPSLILRADRNLYRAKQEGRDRYVA